ncbi:glycosyl hydrolase family 17 protein [Fulvivirga lutea]|uniref:Endo-1,3-beta-glucanase btgC n=1 Tax=Fulvivirga lutea TaxID=2810512 RepID=A0A974ZZN3_9BACT|nr:glycosyl hydrolase family 17 protein [Fulvivirga lutea]QSE96429.1 glycosyl hydrolase family 17 [Fulvivirga lutea]
MNCAVKIIFITTLVACMLSCTNTKKDQSNNKETENKPVTAKDILGKPDYLAISYGGYRTKTREDQPTVQQLKDDLKILSAMGIKILRTYNVQLPHAGNVLKAITELKQEQEGFEMYVMLGAWIDCKNAWTELPPDHNIESEQNEGEIERAVKLVNTYPDIVKVLAIGNEAMVKWAESYYVQPGVILKWVRHVQNLKSTGQLPEDLWITSSDDFSSWGGGDPIYHTADLNSLIQEVDYISMHTYPYHNTHYNPEFWRVPEEEQSLGEVEKINAAMKRSLQFAQNQYDSVVSYMKSIGVDKPVHIGETGWATVSNGHYGSKGSMATDEYKQGLYYNQIREWTNKAGISCFYFEAFNEPWKDAHNPKGSENHFGLFTKSGHAKYALWPHVDSGIFNGLTRDGKKIKKTYGGNIDSLMNHVHTPPLKNVEMSH